MSKPRMSRSTDPDDWGKTDVDYLDVFWYSKEKVQVVAYEYDRDVDDKRKISIEMSLEEWRELDEKVAALKYEYGQRHGED